MCLETYLGDNQTLDLFLQAHINIMSIQKVVYTIGDTFKPQLENLVRNQPFCRHVPKFEETFFFYGNFSKKEFIKWLSDSEAYFILKVSFYQKIEFVIHNVTYSDDDWWFEVLEYRARTNKPLILLWKTKNNYQFQSLYKIIMKRFYTRQMKIKLLLIVFYSTFSNSKVEKYKGQD